MHLETKSTRTGMEYYVVNSMRGLYFDLVPKKNPAQTPVRMDRRDFTKPEWREGCPCVSKGKVFGLASPCGICAKNGWR